MGRHLNWGPVGEVRERVEPGHSRGGQEEWGKESPQMLSGLSSTDQGELRTFYSHYFPLKDSRRLASGLPMPLPAPQGEVSVWERRPNRKPQSIHHAWGWGRAVTTVERPVPFLQAEPGLSFRALEEGQQSRVESVVEEGNWGGDP